MNKTIIELESRITELTSEFGEASIKALNALNSGKLSIEARELVTQNETIAKNYKFALENFLIALDREPLTPEIEHRAEWARKLRALLAKEIDILLRHPTLENYA